MPSVGVFGDDHGSPNVPLFGQQLHLFGCDGLFQEGEVWVVHKAVSVPYTGGLAG